MTNAMLGGTIGPMVADAAVMTAENGRLYPFFTISGITMLPTPAASASDEPVIPLLIMLAPILT